MICGVLPDAAFPRDIWYREYFIPICLTDPLPPSCRKHKYMYGTINNPTDIRCFSL